jgi:flagellar protein FlaG
MKMIPRERHMRIDPTNASVEVASNPSADSIQIQAENRRIVQAVRVVNANNVLGPNQITFGLDRSSRQMVVKIVNSQTNEVVEQIPSAEVLRLAETLKNPD